MRLGANLKNGHFCLLILLLISSIATTTGFNLSPPLAVTRKKGVMSSAPTYLLAKAKNKKKKSSASGGGFGAATTKSDTSSAPTISADKDTLEKQWDTFASITDLEIAPKGNPDDEDYVEFKVADIFVRCGATQSNSEGTGWFRIGKVCVSGETTMDAALTLQKGLIFWTAVHMRRELVAAGGKSGAAALQLGFKTPASLDMGCESDGSLDVEEENEITIATRSSSVKGAKAKAFGFRPDWNPAGFTYKRREKAAMKKKISKLEEMQASAD